jgi:hypothetical protein
VNQYKKIIRFLKILLWVSFISVLLILFVPLIQHRLKLENQASIEFQIDNEIPGFSWLLENEKISVLASDAPKWLFVNSSSKLNAELMARVDDNIFIGEMLYSQFGGDVSKHYFLEQMFNVNYSGYMGKTCKELSNLDDIPQSMIDLYEASGNSWSFYGEGIILTNEVDIIVLLEGEDYHGDFVIETSKGIFPYSGYFEVLEGDVSPEANFSIPVSDRGRAQLEQLGIASKFGASFVVENRLYSGLYFAGGFSQAPVGLPSGYALMPQIMQHKILYDEHMNESLYWKWYYPRMLSLLMEYNNTRYELALDDENDNKFYIDGQQIYQKNDSSDAPFFIKGVNLGAALPGKTFTEFPMDKNIYKNWLGQMAALNVNTVRVYTLLPPSFYQALYEFNDDRDKPIYLLQEIWPEEYPEDHNYLGQAYNETYRQEIEYAVHAMHGNMNIPMRSYRAYGLYSYDVSPYLIGYLVGREMEPQEVQATDELNEGYTFSGRYLYALEKASPTEAWLAESCDYALKVEDLYYKDAPLVAIVNWPTLDPVSHESEWSLLTRKENKYNDNTVVDINHIGIHEDSVSGFFGAYHIYPNYPDFMNNERAYNDYHDDEGPFRYGGYLEEFMAGHKKYPAVVAEYGLSTSLGIAHYSPDGYHHGGLSEEAQAEGIIRMTDAIVEEGYSGAIIFEWMDEWTKKTWITEPYMIPYNKNPYWHNVMDPEQNYGLLAFEPSKVTYVEEGPLSIGQNEAYIYLKVDGSAFVSDKIRLAINTVDDDLGIEEFLLEIGPTTSIRVNPGYNWVDGNYKSTKSNFDEYVDLVQITNAENTSMFGDYMAERKANLSQLKYGSFGDPRHTVFYENGYWIVRLPYSILGISDPSDNKVLYDAEKKTLIGRDEIEIIDSNRIVFRALENQRTYTFELETWDMPEYLSRQKKSFSTLAEYFEGLN